MISCTLNLFRLPLLLWVAFVGLLHAENAPLTFEVRNSRWERFREAVHLTLTPRQAESIKGHRLAEIGPNDEILGTTLHSLDETDPKRPVLSWLPQGITSAGTVRRFAAVSKGAPGAPQAISDLVLEETETHITVFNTYFAVRHPRRGHGGFPDRIRFRLSGNEESRLSFINRLYSRELRRVFSAEPDKGATARVVFQSPTRIVVESSSGYISGADYAPGNPRAVYRYVYSPSSPVVEVSCTATKEDDTFWNEIHFLQPSRSDLHYTRFIVGEPGKIFPMQRPGTKSRAHSGNHWALMATEQDAIGVGPSGVCWDASDEYVYYVDTRSTKWKARTISFRGLLYVGPAVEDFSWFSRWLGSDRDQKVTLSAPSFVAAEPENDKPLTGAHELADEALQIVFADASAGFACMGIENRLGAGARFVFPHDGSPGLWKIEFRAPYEKQAKNEGGRELPGILLDNRSDSVRRAEIRQTPEARILRLTWKNLDLPDEPDAVDVTAEIKLFSRVGRSEWRLSVANRSKRLGLWQTHFPLLSTVSRRGSGDMLLPTGNWGGVLVRGHKGAFTGRYPSGQCPVQFMAFIRGRKGLYFGAHDGAARTKELVITQNQDAAVVTCAEDMGVPGSTVASPFAVVLQAFEGDWWDAARIYRTWAVQQTWTGKGWIRERKDIPSRFLELGLWMLGGGMPQDVRKWMIQAEELFPVPVGLHWYSWHKIPFDHSYPEYFPTKPDFDKVVRELVGRGQVMMPYINGRLWDRDIPSFSTGIKGAAKQRNGEPYTEIYGSKRRLSPMCPVTKLWQDKVNEIIHGLIQECGVNAVYLDQIGAARPRLCFDPSHGHPLGGGRHWVDGYRKMLDRVKAQGVASNVAFTTENTAEPYMDNIDGFLAWSPRYERDVPLLPAVYSGYTIYFTSPQDSKDDLDSFVMAQGRDFLWGCQLGWNGTWILEDRHRAKAEFLGQLCQYRLAAREFLIYGQLLDEVRPTRPVPHRTAVWYRRTRHTATLPAVMGTLWRAGDGSLAVFMVNCDSEPHEFTYTIDTKRWAPNDNRPNGWLCSRLTAEGPSPWKVAGTDQVERSEILAGHEVRAVVLRPAGQIEEAVKQAQRLVKGRSADSPLGAAAREFLFHRTARELGLDITVPAPVLTVAAGEPAEPILNIRSLSKEARSLAVTWADGRVTSHVVAPGKSLEVRHVFWPAEGQRPWSDGGVSVSLGGQTHKLPLYVRRVPTVSVTLGTVPDIRGGESFLLPVEVRNNSRTTRRGALELATPPGWKVEPGSRLAVDKLPPGGRYDFLLKCAPPPTATQKIGQLTLRFIEHTVTTRVTVLKARPSIDCIRLLEPPAIDGKLDEWANLRAFELGVDADSVKIKQHGGPSDCSAKIRMAWDKDHFYLAAEVTDNKHHQKESGFQCWSGDCIQLAFRAGPPGRSHGFDGTEFEVGLTLAPAGPMLFQWTPGRRALDTGKLAIVRKGNISRYEAAVLWSDLGVRPALLPGPVTWSITVNDNDGEGFRGWLEWTPGICGGKDSSAFGWLRFKE